MSKRDKDDERPPPAEEIDAPTTKLVIPISMIDLREVPMHGGDSGVDVTSDLLPDGFLPSVLPFVPVAPPIPPSVAASPAAVIPERTFDVPDVATVAAELAQGSRERVLAANGLTEQRWAEVERRCAAELAREAESRETKLRDAYDEAFLEARARHRGPFGVDAIARLHAELETDSGGAVIDVSLDISDAMRFKRLEARRAAALQSIK